MIILVFFTLAFLVFALTVFVTYVYAAITAAPWVPTKSGNLDEIIQAGGFKKGDKVYELGCGDGRLVFAAAKKGAHAKGYEVSLLVFLLAKLKWLFSENKRNSKIFLKSFWSANLTDADVIFIYLMPGVNKRLAKKFKEELRKGSKIVSCAFEIENLEPKKIIETKLKTKLYIYEM